MSGFSARHGWHQEAPKVSQTRLAAQLAQGDLRAFDRRRGEVRGGLPTSGAGPEARPERTTDVKPPPPPAAGRFAR